ncbi:MAG TPA: hypothetical protein VMW01_00870 [Williamwhitmania sp.]|nr:hypothetical protein [Williamwhitmania sp.]
MQNVISGRLVGIDENKVQIQMPNGMIATYPHNGLNDAGAKVDLQWLYDNMGQSVVCLVIDKVITEANPLGARI